jgi:hypothetical protein
MSDDFYVGYWPKAPAPLARSVRRYVTALVTLALLAAIALVLGQTSFANAKFEYGTYHDYSGLLEQRPGPVLRTPAGSFLLVGPGKHGFAPGHTGMVRLTGSLIERGPNKMLEVPADSVRPAAEHTQQTEVKSLGPITLRGEIVDSKCWLGVMNPGNGEIHRDCAVRCISGGIPPAFAAADASGAMRIFLLSGSDGRSLNREVLPYAGRPIELSGELVRSGELQFIRTEPSTFYR